VFEDLPATQRRHIAALALFGDPRFNPKQQAVDRGDYDKRLWGIFNVLDPEPREIRGNAIPDVHSYCTQGDPVCNYSPKNVAACTLNCAHLQYVIRGWTDLAAFWAVSHWRHKLS